MRHKTESFSATPCHSSFVLSIVPLYNGLPRTMTYKHTCVSVWTIHGEPDSDVITNGKYESLNSSGQVKTALQHCHHLFCIHNDRIPTVVKDHIVFNHSDLLPGATNNLINPRIIISL